MLLTSLDPARSDSVDTAAALSVGARSVSRAQLLEAACALVGALPDGGPVAVCAQPTLETVVAVVGCLLAGVPVVPMPPDSGSAELRHMLTDARVTCWAGPPHRDSDLSAIPATVRRSSGALPEPPSPEAVAMILY
ncbi:AMP-binding protein, partial [Mycobacteriaceae bacterium Msp059]|nr:AMP-binding protein [Mycobacteriaceae bacterium Msp059]